VRHISKIKATAARKMDVFFIFFLRHTKDPCFPECRETREKDPDWVATAGEDAGSLDVGKPKYFSGEVNRSIGNMYRYLLNKVRRHQQFKLFY
jgi:hypothetical protein